MASLQASLNKSLREALSGMAGGSQDDLATVAMALAGLLNPVCSAKHRENVQQLQPCLRLLLQVAGWLYPCFMPSSRLDPAVQGGAQEVWSSCMYLANGILQHHPPTHMPAFLALVQPYTKPRVPGEYPSSPFAALHCCRCLQPYNLHSKHSQSCTTGPCSG
jgi:hypothetical protein